LTWDVTVVRILAASYLSSCARSAGAAADLAASRKEATLYGSYTNSYIFQPIAVESHGAFSASALSFLASLGERLTGTSGDLREMSYAVVKVDYETRRYYYRLLKNRGARLLNTGLKKSQTHSYPAHIL